MYLNYLTEINKVLENYFNCLINLKINDIWNKKQINAFIQSTESQILFFCHVKLYVLVIFCKLFRFELKALDLCEMFSFNFLFTCYFFFEIL